MAVLTGLFISRWKALSIIISGKLRRCGVELRGGSAGEGRRIDIPSKRRQRSAEIRYGGDVIDVWR